MASLRGAFIIDLHLYNPSYRSPRSKPRFLLYVTLTPSHHPVAVLVIHCVPQLPSHLPLHDLVFVSVRVMRQSDTVPRGMVVVLNHIQSGGGHPSESSGHATEAVVVCVKQGRVRVGLGVVEGVGVVVGRQDEVCVRVVVYVPQPLRQAVSQGKCDVTVGVAGHFSFGPGIVVVLGR